MANNTINIQDDIDEGEDESYVEYEILSYPSDNTIEMLAELLKRGDIIVPDYQRKYVWDIKQASLLVESFLLGLPVPPIFLYVRDDNKAEVIDGQQRLLSMSYFLEGYFGQPDHRGKRQTFKLTGLSEKSPFRDKTISTLEDSQQRKIRAAVLRAINIRQLNPRTENTSVFHIFKRLNTGGTSLRPQEIRNAVFRGEIVTQLSELNKNENWKKILGIRSNDKYQKDIELILRLFSLFKKWPNYENPMNEYLNGIMQKNRNFSSQDAFEFKKLWPTTLEKIVSSLGDKPFRPKRVINAAALEAVIITVLENPYITSEDLKSRYFILMENKRFQNFISVSTTNTNVVKERLSLARDILIGH